MIIYGLSSAKFRVILTLGENGEPTQLGPPNHQSWGRVMAVLPPHLQIRAN